MSKNERITYMGYDSPVLKDIFSTFLRMKLEIVNLQKHDFSSIASADPDKQASIDEIKQRIDLLRGIVTDFQKGHPEKFIQYSYKQVQLYEEAARNYKAPEGSTLNEELNLSVPHKSKKKADLLRLASLWKQRALFAASACTPFINPIRSEN